MTSLQRPLTRLEWGFGLRWVLATSVGWVVGFAACETLRAIAEFLAHPPTDGAVIGIFIGIAQWLILKGRIHRAGWWILATIIGFGLGKAVGDAVAQAVTGALGFGLDGAVIGSSLGVAQWLVLRRHVAQASWWMLASSVAWAVGWSVIRIIDETAGGPGGMAYVIGATGAAAAGAITGATLIWLLRRRSASGAPSRAP